ncbi:transcriptional regulator [Halobacteriaceae archaeon GCM10025711]
MATDRTGRERARWMRPADDAILEFLSTERAQYPAIIANRLGMHTTFIESRCEALADNGLIEPATAEVVYRITDTGLAYLDGSVAVRSADDAASKE